jgi:alpha-amylase/alpha-mannosidase (GH57 family)
MDLSFVWHFHQPVYRDPETREYVLPWVNYHAVKNYHQMAIILEETEYPCTFNFVPCLVEQVIEYADGTANDPYLAALEKNPDSLTFSDVQLLRRFGLSDPDRKTLQDEALRSFFSPLLTGKTSREDLLALRKRILKNLLPSYRRLMEKGLAEIITSPYYHPLLPLIFDVQAPDGEIRPALPFRHPEDGQAQLRKGWSYFQSVFGRPPAGLWPSEGGISQEVAGAIAGCGYPFALTDENVLWKSLKTTRRPKDLYRPYLCDKLGLFFRDRELSDLISFEYMKWPEVEAVADFMRRLDERRKEAGDDEAVCVIVLDGENPWEYYSSNGVPFLRGLFNRLKASRDWTPTHLGDYLVKHPPRKELKLVPGTWLGNFSKWIGHPAKNAAWDRLSKSRDLCGPLEEIYIAEASDWFWWYGEKGKEVFDELFRAYLRKAHKITGVMESA